MIEEGDEGDVDERENGKLLGNLEPCQKEERNIDDEVEDGYQRRLHLKQMDPREHLDEFDDSLGDTGRTAGNKGVYRCDRGLHPFFDAGERRGDEGAETISEDKGGKGLEKEFAYPDGPCFDLWMVNQEGARFILGLAEPFHG